MVNGRRRPVAPVRKLVASVLGTFAAFVVLFGAGMTSLRIIALGIALLAVAIAIVVVTNVRGGPRAWVTGSAHVHAVSEPPASSTFGRCELQIVIDAPGLPPRSVKLRDPRVPVAKWPDPGATLPILVAVDDQRHVRVLWDEVLTHAEAAVATGTHGPRDGGPDLLGDPLLVEEAPPWARRDPAEDFLPPEDFLPSEDDLLGPGDDDRATIDLSDDLPARDEPDLLDDLGDDPIIVRNTPNGPVLEGSLVDPPAVVPLPRRPTTIPPEADTPEPPTPSKPQPADLDADLDAGNGSGSGSIRQVGLTVLVADLDRSLTFYRDSLGFGEVDRGDDSAVLASGATRIVLRASREAAPVNRRVVHLNLEVDDVDAVYQELKSKGVRFTYPPRPVNRAGKLEQWAAAFRDPDGHGVALTQWRQRSGD